MVLQSDIFDLSGLHLSSGEGRRLDLAVTIDPFELAGERYEVTPELVPARLDVSRTTGDGYALRLRLAAQLNGPCMRCLALATPTLAIDAREVSLPTEGEELESPYVTRATPTRLDLGGWARDATALMVPAPLLCRTDCAGLCPRCGADLNFAGSDHVHEREPDLRWAKLSELRFD